MKKIVKSNVGRPTKYSPQVVEKLIEVFKIGGTVEEACGVAQIDKVTYYTWLEKYPDFSTEIVSAQHYADVESKRLVTTSIVKGKNIENAKWWLEKRVFKNQTNVIGQQNNYQVVIEDYEETP